MGESGILSGPGLERIRVTPIILIAPATPACTSSNMMKPQTNLLR